MTTLRATVTGLDRLRVSMQALQQGLQEAGKIAVARTVADVFVASQELVPVDTGALKESGMVSEVVELADGNLAAAISYGQGLEDGGIYAVVQHEDMDLNHPNGGSAKYLEGPVYSVGPGIFERNIASEIRKVLK